MTLRRKAIREKARDVIVAASTGLEDRVHENRVLPFQHRHLPAASIFTRSETVEALDEAPLAYVRDCELVVQIVVDGNSDVDDLADELCAEVETAIHHSVRLEGLVSKLRLTRVEGPELDMEGSRILAGVNLVFSATYEQDATGAPSATDDFAGADVDYETHAARTGAEASDTVELETV